MRRPLKTFIIFLSFLAGLATLGVLDLYRFAHQTSSQTPKIILIEPGSSLTKITRQLYDQRLINSKQRFIILNRLLRSATLLKAGEYEIKTATTPLQIITILKSGLVYQRQFSIPEGFTLRQIGARLQSLGICQDCEFKKLTTTPKQLRKWPASSDTNLEGYLFPSTYNYNRQTSCRKVLELMLDTGQKQFNKLTHENPDNPLNKHQLITLASLIQKEAGNNDEMPIISSVFHNRLQKNMRLASDPTTIYALGEDFDGNLRRRDLHHPSPYNTYRHRGLPPGPICSPGNAALHAALKPAHTDYLYFVSRGNGRHQFSRNLKEHNQAVKKYQLKQ